MNFEERIEECVSSHNLAKELLHKQKEKGISQEIVIAYLSVASTLATLIKIPPDAFKSLLYSTVELYNRIYAEEYPDGAN